MQPVKMAPYYAYDVRQYLDKIFQIVGFAEEVRLSGRRGLLTTRDFGYA